jgi:hypothetical protein
VSGRHTFLVISTGTRARRCAAGPPVGPRDVEARGDAEDRPDIGSGGRSCSRRGPATNVSGFVVLVSVLVFGSLFGIIGAIIGVPIAAAIGIIVDETTASRRALIAADDATREQPA